MPVGLKFHKNMFEEFEKWFLSKELLKKKELTVTIIKPSGTENSCNYADIFTDKVYARASIWESNEFQLEAIDSKTEKIIIFEYYQITNQQQLYELLGNFIDKIVKYT